MSRSLILDPRTERASNAPLEIFTEPGKGPGVYVTDHKYPDPEQEILSAGGREGRRRTGPPILGNRQIPLEFFVMGRREDYPTAPVQLLRNPSGETNTTFWNLNKAEWAAGALAQEKISTRGLTFGIGEMGIHVTATKDATVTGRNLSVTQSTALGTVTPGKPYSFGLPLWVLDALGSGMFARIDWYTAGAVYIASTPTSGTYVGSGETFLRVENHVAPATASFATLVLLGSSAVSGDTVDFWTDAWQFNEGATLLPYFDGDQPGCAWTGTPHASTSTQPANGDDHFEAMVGDLEGKLAKFREEGGTYSRPYRSGRLIFDVEGLVAGDAGGYEGKRWIQRGQKFATTLECLPHGRGETQLRSLRSQTTDPVLVFTEELVPGAVRALGELEIADIATIPRRGCVAGIEVPGALYDPTAATAALYYQAEALTPLGPSTLAAAAGATGAGNNTIQTVLESAWRTIASTKIAASGKHLTHVGTFRIFARIRASGFVERGQLQYRLQWGQGDLVERVTNDPAVILARSAAGYFIVDLGLVRIRPAKVGTQRWEGQIIARSYDPAGSAYKPQSNIDDLRIVPVNDAFLRARAPLPVLSAPTAFVGRDGFNQTAGALGGKSADEGGVWASTFTTADFQVDSANKRLKRTVEKEAKAVLPTVMTSTAARVSLPILGSETSQGILLRYVDANNYLLFWRSSGLLPSYGITKRVAGTLSYVQWETWTPGPGDLAGYVASSGYCALYMPSIGGELGTPVIEAYDPVLATGGALASGKAGLWENAGSELFPRVGEAVYDDFTAWAPTEPVLIAPGRRIRWRHDGVQREDAAGGELWSPIGYEGDPLLVPPATEEKRLMRAIVFPTRGDLETVADEGASDDFTSQLAVTSRHVSVR